MKALKKAKQRELEAKALEERADHFRARVEELGKVIDANPYPRPFTAAA